MNRGVNPPPRQFQPWHCVMMQTDAKFCVLVTNDDRVRLSIPPPLFKISGSTTVPALLGRWCITKLNSSVLSSISQAARTVRMTLSITVTGVPSVLNPIVWHRN